MWCIHCQYHMEHIFKNLWKNEEFLYIAAGDIHYTS